MRYRLFIFIYLGAIWQMQVAAQEKISFYSSDSLKITADFYRSSENAPWIILLHQAESSRGEYTDIAKKFMKLGFSALAVDLRTGGKANFLTNETAQQAAEANYPSRFLDARNDIEAAIDYATLKSGKKVLLMGSSFSASLSLMIAASDNRILGIMALSPGEFFSPLFQVRDSIDFIEVPVFVGCAKNEKDYVSHLINKIDDEFITFFYPAEFRGSHGARSLWDTDPVSDEYWLSLTMFLNKFK